MIRDDFLMRQIQLLAQIVARLVGLRHATQHETALQETEQALDRLLGMGPGLAAGFSPEELVAQLAHGTTAELARGRGALLAALFHEQAMNLAALQRSVEAQGFEVRAVRAVLALRAPDGALPLPEYAPRLEDLVWGIAASDLPRELSVALFLALEGAGAFGKAEDWLFELRAAEPADAAIVALGEAFYTRLEAQSDAALAAGNLPRAEIVAGRAALQAARG